MIDFLLRPIRRNFGRDKMFYRAIDDMFGFIPHNIELYKLALIHKSASIILDNGQHINNERLEFLGDAVIESVSSDYLFIEFPDKNEGFLTQMRSKMVSRQSLNGVAKRIGLDEHVITNSSNNNAQKHIFGDAFEAMMGAIYLDQGYDFVNRLLINNIFIKHLKLDTLVESETDFKSRLIEWCQKNHHTIHFHTIHDKNYSSSHPFFYSKVLIDSIEVGYGAGESKKEAEQRAAYSVSQGFNDADCTKLLDKLDNIDAHERATQQKSQRQESRKSEEKREDNNTSTKREKRKTEEKPNDKDTAAKREEKSVPNSEEKRISETEAVAEQSADQQDNSTTQETKPKSARRSRRSAKSKPSGEESATTEAPIKGENTPNEALDTEMEKPIGQSETTQTNAEETKQEAPITKKSRTTKRAKSVKEPKESQAPQETKETKVVNSGKKSKSVAETSAESEVATEAETDAPKPKTRRRRTAKPKGEQSKQNMEQGDNAESSSSNIDTTAQTTDNQ